LRASLPRYLALTRLHETIYDLQPDNKGGMLVVLIDGANQAQPLYDS